MTTAIELFYSYAHEDEELRNQLDKHLRLLQRQGYLSTWYDRDIRAGGDLANEINAHLESAQIILLLISADFLASDYCIGVEMQRALERHQAGNARVIPIILRPVDWQQDPALSKLKALPTDGKPVITWPSPPNFDAAFEDIAKGIRKVVEELRADPGPMSSQPAKIWNVPMRRNPFFTGREQLLEQLHERLTTTRTAALTQPQAISGLGGIVRHEAARVIVSGNNGVRTKPAVPPAVSLNGEAGRQPPVRSPLTTTLNHKVGSQTARGDCYLLASKRIRG